MGFHYGNKGHDITMLTKNGIELKNRQKIEAEGKSCFQNDLNRTDIKVSPSVTNKDLSSPAHL